MNGNLYIICGIPGSGKSTIAKELLKKNEDNAIHISRDEVRYSIIKDDEQYFSHENDVYKEFCNRITLGLQNNKNVLADATHLTRKSRARLLKNLKCKPNKINCIWVNTDFQTCWNRNESREGREKVPPQQMYKFRNIFQTPSYIEGFDLIIVYQNNKPVIMK